MYLIYSYYACVPQEMSSLESVNYDAAASATGRFLPVESAMPGTTLGIIRLQV